MTYEQLLSRLETIITAHKFIREYGYGDISDIAVPEDRERPDYPYAFINPVNVSVSERQFSATFNLIMMTQVLDSEDDEIFGQSNCMKYINDVLSQFVMTNNDPLISVSFPVNMTPFKERFQDDVVGATAQVTFSYGKAMSVCDSPISAISPSTPYCPQVLVIDGDETQHYIDAGDTYSCLPATAKSGIFYQRQIPWENNDPNVVGSVYWHVQNGTYDYTPPSNPLYVASLKNGYEGSDERCLMMQPNQFGNFFRFTNDRGQQYTEGFADSAQNLSDDPRYCIDHLNGLGWYVQRANVDNVNRTFAQAIQFANTFSYNGRGDWRVAGISEYLNSVNFNDYQNSFGNVYCPFIDPVTRNYGGFFHSGTFTKDNQYVAMATNSGTISLSTNPAALRGHILLVRNHYI
jgi:hypothetical protein